MPYNGADETSFITQLKTLGLPVYEAEMPEDTELNVNQYGTFSPFYVVTFGAPYTLRRERSFNGIAKDPFRVPVLVQTCASNTDDLRTHRVAMFNALVGFYPTDSGEVSPDFGRYFTYGSNEVRPTIYGHSTMFTYMTNVSME